MVDCCVVAFDLGMLPGPLRFHKFMPTQDEVAGEGSDVEDENSEDEGAESSVGESDQEETGGDTGVAARPAAASQPARSSCGESITKDSLPGVPLRGPLGRIYY